MRPKPLILLCLLLAVVAITLLAAVLAAPVQSAVADAGWFSVDPARPDRLFLKVFRRLLLIPLVLLVVLCLRPWRSHDPSFFGLRGPHARPVAALGCGALVWVLGAGIVWLHFLSGRLEFEDPLLLGKFFGRAGKYLGVGLFVGVLEEAFFRGWLWKHVGRGRRSLRAAVATSAIYAGLHAFRVGALEERVTHDAAGALTALGLWLRHLLDVAEFGPRFLGLFLFGLLLSALYRRRGNLWACVGVHAAGVSLVYGYGALTSDLSARTWAGGKLLYDGPAGWILLAAVGLWLWLRPVRTPDGSTGYQEQA